MIPRQIGDARIPTQARKAIELLCERADKAREAALNSLHGPLTCPIGATYGLNAAAFWPLLSFSDRRRLKKFGWNWRMYRSLIRWYDTPLYESVYLVLTDRQDEIWAERRRRESVLVELLTIS